MLSWRGQAQLFVLLYFNDAIFSLGRSQLSLAYGISGSNLAGDVSVSCECCVLSGISLYVGLITRPEESYRVLCV